MMREGGGKGGGANAGVRWSKYTGRLSTRVTTSSPSSTPPHHHPPLPLPEAAHAVSRVTLFLRTTTGSTAAGVRFRVPSGDH